MCTGRSRVFHGAGVNDVLSHVGEGLVLQAAGNSVVQPAAAAGQVGHHAGEGCLSLCLPLHPPPPSAAALLHTQTQHTSISDTHNDTHADPNPHVHALPLHACMTCILSRKSNTCIDTTDPPLHSSPTGGWYHLPQSVLLCLVIRALLPGTSRHARQTLAAFSMRDGVCVCAHTCTQTHTYLHTLAHPHSPPSFSHTHTHSTGRHGLPAMGFCHGCCGLRPLPQCSAPESGVLRQQQAPGWLLEHNNGHILAAVRLLTAHESIPKNMSEHTCVNTHTHDTHTHTHHTTFHHTTGMSTSD
jgi:hypothetical protein